MCQGITHGWPSSRSTLSWGLQVHRCLLRRIHGCVIPGRSSTKGSVGPSGTCFSYAGVPSSSEGGAYAEESCSDGLARHPAGTAKTLGRRWWCTLNRHLVRSRFSETVSIPPREREICVAIWKTCPERASYFKKVCLCFPSFFPDS